MSTWYIGVDCRHLTELHIWCWTGWASNRDP